jgi:PIN domain nuclease of toxin-antitoxin system
MDVRRVVAVKLLIDTHVLFWCLVGDPKLPEAASQDVV